MVMHMSDVECDFLGKVEGQEMGRGQSLTGVWGKGWGSAHPSTHAGLSHTTRQCTHSSRHVLGPLWLPSSLAPCLSTHWRRAIPSLREYGAVSPT